MIKQSNTWSKDGYLLCELNYNTIFSKKVLNNFEVMTNYTVAVTSHARRNNVISLAWILPNFHFHRDRKSTRLNTLSLHDALPIFYTKVRFHQSNNLLFNPKIVICCVSSTITLFLVKRFKTTLKSWLTT